MENPIPILHTSYDPKAFDSLENVFNKLSFLGT